MTFLIVFIAINRNEAAAEARDTPRRKAISSQHISLVALLRLDHESLILDPLGVKVRDVRKPPHMKDLHFFSGKIEEVDCLKIAIMGTDSAIGKRTTAWVLVDALNEKGYRAEMVGTGQTAWFQGVKYGVCMDSLVNDFVAGEIEHAVWSAWKNEKPDVIIIEGQGSLMNPAYPGGFEIMAAGRPDDLILQHAPARLYYDGFPGYPLHSLRKQIRALEMISGKVVIAVTLNHERMKKQEVLAECEDIENDFDLPALDVLLQGPDRLLDIIIDDIQTKRKMLSEVKDIATMEV